jgi:hypothetical protein
VAVYLDEEEAIDGQYEFCYDSILENKIFPWSEVEPER